MEFSQDSVGEILIAVIELGRQGVQRVLDQLVDFAVELLLGEVHVEAIAEIADGGGAAVLEAWQLRTWEINL